MVDLAFISLRLVLPAILPLVPDGPVLPLVKPQFEVGRGQVGRGGVVRDEELRRDAILGVARRVTEIGRGVTDMIASPLAAFTTKKMQMQNLRVIIGVLVTVLGALTLVKTYVLN